jgi:magnesium chelatase family protein
MVGPPVAGKTMLARRLPTILPPLSIEEALETTMIHSVAGKLEKKGSILTSRPFRR